MCYGLAVKIITKEQYMKHRRTTEQLKQTVLKTEADIQSGKFVSVKEACVKNKIKPSAFYDKSKVFVTGAGQPKMVNNVEAKVRDLQAENNRLKIKLADMMLEKDV
jgi:hypothetical protein